jgi:hypothetical protein
MSDKINFAKGIYPKAIPTKFGTMQKLSIKVQDFMDWLSLQEHPNGYVNLEIKTSKEGKQYVQVDTWRPDASKQQATQAPTVDDVNSDLPF